ncbi:hypothetical protein KCTC52924_00903 [Arenibacter antarcticus]|uniref:Reprolysin-like metallopeptidase n=1 Tax=Arenibacter antarcticus TaxID=2040469 RepID=A0ABW5VC91_9FLAO|nr:zinc-dependent metalloprotease family protein [Arenibacter sp. H213]MCM4167595.1 proprotein convertase P [Arenibacter sp. H213]
MVVKLRLVLSISIFFLSYYGAAQSSYWEKRDSYSRTSQKHLSQLEIKKAKIFTLDTSVFRNEIKASTSKKVKKVLVFPDEDGNLIPFQIEESAVLSPALSQKYPEIKSYVGLSLDKKGDRIRFSVSHKGIQSMIVHANGKSATFMQKSSQSNNEYIVYNRGDTYMMDTNFICETKSALETGKGISTNKLVDGQVLRKYRIAISATGEYTAFHGGTVLDALAAINATITRINEVFERDLAISLEIVTDTDKVIYTNKNSDPYGINLNTEVQSTLNTIIGPTNYDLGHLFHKDQNGGNAGFIGSVCIDSRKGSAYSSAITPQGDVFDMDFVAHELGHQFGANHTWSFESEGTLIQAEPGSGSTIMGYAGISGNNNVTLSGDDYFHYFSILQISEYAKTTSCSQEIAIINNPPQIIPTNGHTIPKTTAFVLTGNATDVDVDDILTYNWEQVNDGVVTQTSFGPTNLSGANFRSLQPSVKSSRYFPKLSSIVSGNLTQTNPTTNSTWETVSDVERDLDFALTVRDNSSGGGQVDSDLIKVRVTNQAGPFLITSQASTETYIAGTRQEVIWDVANTDQQPVNEQKVDIYFSANGGASFPIQLAEGVPNDGRHEILIPSFATPTARIMVRAHNNIFLAVNTTNFIIAESEIVLDFPKLQYEVCQGNDLSTPFTYTTFDGFSEEATFSVTGIPPGLGVDFSPLSTAVNDTLVDITFSNTNAANPGLYPITITATTISHTKSIVIDLNILDTNFTDVVLQLPANGATDTGIGTKLEWESNPNYSAFEVEIAEDPGFTTIIETNNTIFNTYLTNSLTEGETYYWRVKPINSCGEGTFSPPFSFSTIDLDCYTKIASGLPMTISSSGTSTTTSTITVLNDLPIADINVNLDLTHSFLADLEISLISPSGTRVTLVSNSCGGNQNILANFDDDADSFICGTVPAIQGSVKPLGSLSVFNGESTFGDWILEIKDIATSDGGALKAFSMDICVEGVLRIDNDKDGVFDDGDDLCLGTPPGTLVNLNGCPVYIFPTDNFEVEINSESCRGKNDGSLRINAAMNLTYQISVVGMGVTISTDFTNFHFEQNLSAGIYTICIVGTDEDKTYEEYCFEAIVNEPPPLTVTSKLTPDGKQAILTLEGSNEYQIELNGILTTSTSPNVMLDLKKGVNHLKVYTNIPCQGVFEDQFLLLYKPQASPNPFKEEVNISLEQITESVDVETYTFTGQYIGRKTYQPNKDGFTIDFSGLPSGIYILKVKGATVNSTIRVIKK